MKQKALFILLMVLLLQTGAKAQQKPSIVRVRGGVSLLVPWPGGGKAFLVPSITIGPVLKIINAHSFNLDLAAPLSLGRSPSSPTHRDVGIDMPAMLECHFGTPDAPGLVLGGGVAFTLAGNISENNTPPTKDDLKFWNYRGLLGVSFEKNENNDGLMVAGIIGRSFSGRKFITGLCITVDL